MSYFNHAFTKRFLGTGNTRAPQTPTVTNPASTAGFITTTGVSTTTLSKLTPGYFGLFDPKTWKTVAAPTGCCPLVLASSSLLANDKIGPFHGGYKETNKSKVINPKFVHKFYRVDPCTPQQSVVSIGNTVYTDDAILTFTVTDPGTGYIDGVYTNVPLTGGTGYNATANITIAGGTATVVAIANPGTGYTALDVLNPDTGVVGTPTGGDALDIRVDTVGTGSNCCYEFLCGETYYLRIDVKGSPALRFMNHNAYQNVYAYTGCCSGPTPTAVDSTLVMIAWAQMIVENNYLNPFVFPIVYDEAGNAWFPPNSTTDPFGNAISPTDWWSAYVSTGHTPGECAGIRLFGAYVETKFGNCSFQVTDFFEKQPVTILASLVDQNGDPCTFEGICVVQECRGVQGVGFGEQVVRDLILSESYLQNFFHTDIRIREITQGDDILNSVDRDILYYRYYILHSVPRYNNPTGVFDTEQYMLEIITDGVNADFETYMSTWLGYCPNCVSLETHACTPCVILPVNGIIVP